jgi:mono/diheme cytochrome c family protein
VPLGWWYYHALPEAVKTAILPGSIAMTALQVMLFSAALLFLLTLLGSVAFPRQAGYISAMILLLLGLASLGGFEWAREAARRPFIIHDFLYSNSLMASQAPTLPAERPLPIKYTSGNRGHDLYLAGCRSCHTISGYLSLSGRVAGLDRAWLVNIIPRLQYFRPPMPPFPGNEDDIWALADYLTTIAAPDPLTTHPDMTESEKAEIVFGRRCGGCHTLDGYRPIGQAFAGLDSADADDAVMMLTEFTDQMPPFTGTDEEKQLLIIYLTGAKP